MRDEEQFEKFVAGRADALLRFGYVLSGDPHDAADLVQEALARLRGSWARVQRKDDPESYVRTTMTRLHVRAWRLRARERPTAEPPDYGGPDVYDETSDLSDALARLPRRQRAVIVLRYYTGLPDEEIAATLGVSQGTVRSQAFRGLARLRGELTADVVRRR
ncbi:SigE family RNA polymerase sigma factor [Acrocarpospora catenulata]|uniref:SigE family RNA polymerase sigma factor n=1 Tax=Acrocarpospora catenulata TaxID=2836182 RepID=UPI001BD96E60|nr:SigE family RNA polymerase sigma factor [Acrocarpospora catenulata]